LAVLSCSSVDDTFGARERRWAAIGGPAMRPCSLRGVVAQSGAILHVTTLVPEPPSIGRFSASMPRMTGSRLSERC
jgi:hypothetical protein